MQAERLLALIDAVAHWRNELADDEEHELANELRDFEAQLRIRWHKRRAEQEQGEGE